LKIEDVAMDSLVSQQVERMVAAWQRGERPLAEEFLVSQPGFDDEAVIRLIFEEACLRQEAGMEVDRLELARRFPRLWPELELLLDCQQLMEPVSTAAVLPEEGEELAGFRLLAELGRGSSGKVFLASQLALADRPVVIKVTPLGREEHLSLARLQHMNIVQLYAAQVLHDRRLQMLCMPFLGGASLAQVLDLLKDQEPSRRTGSQLVEALDQVQASLPVTLSARGPFRHYIGRSSYVEAICWVGICLADGLQYAHERNFVHMDIKPSNVLLTGDGQPMLLDFHLAREPIAQGDPAPDHLGGTPGYLAPEQLEAMIAVREGRVVPTALDGRVDIYSLGLVLHEALGGLSSTIGLRRPLHRCNPRVSVGLSDIIEKCMRPDPRDRYPDAAALAADLRRLLDGQSLRGVPNRSPVERWRKWRRRRPHALVRGLMLLAALITLTTVSALLLTGYVQRVHDIEASLADARASIARHHYPEATKALKHGLSLAEHLPAIGPYRAELADALARADRLAKVEDLHRLAELVRFRYGLDPPGPEEARALILRAQAAWQDRELLLKPPGLKAEGVVRADLLDFALAWVGFRVRLAPATEADNARREALRVLDEAEELLGPSAAIDRERRLHGGLFARADTAPALASRPCSARERFVLGMSYLRSGEESRAAEQFQLGLDLRPQDFWLNFYQGLCAFRLGRFDESVDAFRVCIALAPESAECFHNRALALGALGLTGKAIDDYTHALERNPALTAASLNRGMLHYREGHLIEAAADLNQALATTTGRREQGIIYYNLSLVDLAHGDRAAALSNLKVAVSHGDEAARELQDRLQK
jgi:serine/threonine protein kinase/tetratricopeptide (TPR) repeat protein